MATPNTHYGEKGIAQMLEGKNPCRMFFCGIGGINMSSLARMTKSRGFSVCGSDRSLSPMTEALAAEGIPVFSPQCADNVKDVDLFVYTVAVSPDNPEYERAGALGIPRVSRADYLGYLMSGSRMRIGVCGTHGKSTASAMCAGVFECGGKDPTVMCGADMSLPGGCLGAYRPGKEDVFIFEACEYMDSFLDFCPTVAVILNLEMDHVDYFHSMEQLRASYAAFAEISVRNGGYVLYYGEDPEAARALGEIPADRKRTFGFSPSDDYCADALADSHGCYRFTVCEKNGTATRVSLRVPGRHNVLNALAAFAAAREDGIAPDVAAAGLAAFGGIHRRMEYKGHLGRACVYDDYAHHPTEIRASLTAARSMAGKGRLLCLFQSHTYSRTAALLPEMAAALRLADEILVAPIYAARETDTLGMDQYRMAEAVGKGARGCADLKEAAEQLIRLVQDGDTVIVMGAGNVDGVFAMLPLEK